jgi:hypothetical protein
VRLWNPITGKELHKLSGNAERVIQGSAHYPDRGRLALPGGYHGKLAAVD